MPPSRRPLRRSTLLLPIALMPVIKPERCGHDRTRDRTSPPQAGEDLHGQSDARMSEEQLDAEIEMLLSEVGAGYPSVKRSLRGVRGLDERYGPPDRAPPGLAVPVGPPHQSPHVRVVSRVCMRGVLPARQQATLHGRA